MAHRAPQSPVIAIIGTTGTGKSQLAVDIALEHNGEIINADAVQMYDGLPIITNKIAVPERKGVPHHLLGCIGLEQQSWRVDKFVKRAGEVMAEIRRRGKLPIVVGGTHYYTQSLLFRDSLAMEDPKGQQSQEVDRGGDPEEQDDDTDSRFPVLKASTQDMLEELREIDPVMAARWHPNDRRKIRRSLEIYYNTGRRASEVYAEQLVRRQRADVDFRRESSCQDEGFALDTEIDGSATGLRHPTLFLWTHTPRDVLRDRIRQRVENMVEQGLFEEAQSLRGFAREQEAAGSPIDHTKGVFISIGYKECLPYLSALEDSETEEKVLARLQNEAVEKTKTATWQYAKYQERWIRIKLLKAIKQAGAEQSIRVLDTSFPDYWEDQVSSLALDAVRAFLNGDSLEGRSSGSVAATKALAALDGIDATDGQIPQTQSCDLCHVTATTEQEWKKHVNSNRHRKTVKAKQKKVETQQDHDAAH